MEFKLNEDQQMIHDLAKDFAESVLQPRIDEIEAGEMTEVSNGEKHPQLPHDIHQQLAECGFIGISFPEEYNGLGMGHVEQAIVIKELSRISCLRGEQKGCEKAGHCRALPLWEGLDQVIDQYLDSVSLADLQKVEETP